jgi:hypothetical protein
VLGYGLDDWGSRVWFLAGAGNFSLHHFVQHSTGAHPASYPVGTRGSFPGGKVVRVWSWPLTSTWCLGPDCVELYLYSPNMPSWHGAQLKHRDNFTFTFTLLSCFSPLSDAFYYPSRKNVSFVLMSVCVWMQVKSAATTWLPCVPGCLIPSDCPHASEFTGSCSHNAAGNKSSTVNHFSEYFLHVLFSRFIIMCRCAQNIVFFF